MGQLCPSGQISVGELPNRNSEVADFRGLFVWGSEGPRGNQRPLSTHYGSTAESLQLMRRRLKVGREVVWSNRGNPTERLVHRGGIRRNLGMVAIRDRCPQGFTVFQDLWRLQWGRCGGTRMLSWELGWKRSKTEQGSASTSRWYSAEGASVSGSHQRDPDTVYNNYSYRGGIKSDFWLLAICGAMMFTQHEIGHNSPMELMSNGGLDLVSGGFFREWRWNAARNCSSTRGYRRDLAEEMSLVMGEHKHDPSDMTSKVAWNGWCYLRTKPTRLLAVCEWGKPFCYLSDSVPGCNCFNGLPNNKLYSESVCSHLTMCDYAVLYVKAFLKVKDMMETPRVAGALVFNNPKKDSRNSCIGIARFAKNFPLIQLLAEVLNSSGEELVKLTTALKIPQFVAGSLRATLWKTSPKKDIEVIHNPNTFSGSTHLTLIVFSFKSSQIKLGIGEISAVFSLPWNTFGWGTVHTCRMQNERTKK